MPIKDQIMASNKPQRWYEVVGDTAYIYDAPNPKDSMGVSVVSVADFSYYRTRFNLSKIWTN